MLAKAIDHVAVGLGGSAIPHWDAPGAPFCDSAIHRDMTGDLRSR